MTHGHARRRREAVVAEIEARVRGHGHTLAPVEGATLAPARARQHAARRGRRRRCFAPIRRRTLVGLCLMAAQAFFYNAIFFTYALVLTDFYGVAGRSRRLVHPAVRGGQFPRAVAARPAVRHDRAPDHDRRDLCALRRSARGTGYLFSTGCCRRETQTIAWMVIFFFASAAASSAYLTVERDLSARDPRARDRVLLRGRHRARRRGRPVAVRRADRHAARAPACSSAICSARR